MALEFHKISIRRHEALYRVDLDGVKVGNLSRLDYNKWTYTDVNSTKSSHIGGFYKVVRELRDQLRKSGGDPDA